MSILLTIVVHSLWVSEIIAFDNKPDPCLNRTVEQSQQLYGVAPPEHLRGHLLLFDSVPGHIFSLFFPLAYSGYNFVLPERRCLARY